MCIKSNNYIEIIQKFCTVVYNYRKSTGEHSQNFFYVLHTLVSSIKMKGLWQTPNLISGWWWKKFPTDPKLTYSKFESVASRSVRMYVSTNTYVWKYVKRWMCTTIVELVKVTSVASNPISLFFSSFRGEMF